jgi:hypothetical protein
MNDMLRVKENFLETIKPDGKPDRLVNCYEFMGLLFAPATTLEHHSASPGQTAKDGFGVTWKWGLGQPAAAPWHTPDTIVLEDITKWRETVVFPEIDIPLDYGPTVAKKDGYEAAGLLSTVLLPAGIFERMHLLLGFEGALVALMEEPEAFGELAAALCEFKMTHARLIVENIKPEAVLIHDDWGLKTNLFMPPDLWRAYLKPHYARLNKYFKDNGVITIHHADSWLEPITVDMSEIHTDCWQGVLPQNDIAAIQRNLHGRMALMGGIDAAVVDTEDADEATIRAHVRDACARFGPAGHFIPSYTYGGFATKADLIYPGKQTVIEDEINRYNKDIYGVASSDDPAWGTCAITPFN